MNPTRSYTVGAAHRGASAYRSADAAHLKIGTAVQILPLGHPLRLAEETATIDQISGGRLVFGVGRSAFPRAYDAYGISYQESQDRFTESLDIIKAAWTRPVSSHIGRYWNFENSSLLGAPPVAATAPPGSRIAASQPDTYSRDSRHTRFYLVVRGCCGGQPNGRFFPPIHLWALTVTPGVRPYWPRRSLSLQNRSTSLETRERALAEAQDGLMRFATYRADLVRWAANV